MNHYRLLSIVLVHLGGLGLYAADPPGPAVDLDTVALNESTLRVHFIDVGPGLAALIETPSGRHYIVDGGKWGLDGMERYVQHFVPPNTPINAAIVTHADSDHYKGLLRIFARYDVGEFWYTGYTSDKLDTINAWDNLLTAVDDEQGCIAYTPISDFVDAGDSVSIDDLNTPDNPSDDVVVVFLNVDQQPPEFGPIFGRRFDEGERRNNASLVFKVIYKDVSFLFTGDINGRERNHRDPSTDNEIDSEELELWVRHQLDPKYSLTATVMQAPHHGSNGSCSLPFVQAVDPEWVVITAGHQYDHPSVGALRRLVTAGVNPTHILRTDDGDSTPENNTDRDPRGDDSFVFETDGDNVTRILRVSLD